MLIAKYFLSVVALCFGVSFAAAAKDIPPGDVIIKDGAAATSLTGAAGDPKAGRKYFANRKLGNCLACHANKEMSEQLFHGEIGPPLDGVGLRWNAAQLRAIIANSKAVFGPETVMPGFYSLDVGKNVRKDLVGNTNPHIE